MKTLCFFELPKQQSSNDQRNEQLISLAFLNNISQSDSINMDSLSPVYFNRVLEENTIRIYNNWDAVSLLDTLTIVAQGEIKKNWVIDYYCIYMHLIYVKSFSYLSNYQLGQPDISYRKIKDIRDRVLSFFNENQFSSISYNFLPNDIYQKIKTGLQIEQDFIVLKEKVESIRENVQEFQNANITVLLAVLSVLGFIPAISGIASSIKGILLYFKYPEQKASDIEFIAFVILCVCSLLMIFSFVLISYRKKLFKKKI